MAVYLKSLAAIDIGGAVELSGRARGAGETLACGTGACAAAVALRAKRALITHMTYQIDYETYTARLRRTFPLGLRERHHRRRSCRRGRQGHRPWERRRLVRHVGIHLDQ